mgnify:CR=1 FL=1
MTGYDITLEFKDGKCNVVCTGDQLTQAVYAGQDGADYVVSITFNEEGKKAFADATKTAYQNKSYIAIYMDGAEYSRPNVNAAITDGKAIITCSTEEAAKNMAIVLQSGAMPLEIKELNANVVSAALGAEALNNAMLGGLMYAFSGFSIYNIFFNHFHEAIIVFPLLLLAIELLITENRRGVFMFAVCFSALANYFFFFGMVVFTLIYFFVRLFSGAIKVRFSRFLVIIFEAVIGLLMAAFLLLPVAFSS